MAGHIDIEALQAAVAYLQVLKETREDDSSKRQQVAAAVSANLSRFKERVKLNVGGARFETSLSTLRRYEDSMLGTMFSGREGIVVPTDLDGSVFIDRDGAHFGSILNFLRTGQIAAPPSTHRERVELLAEARFYLLEDGVAAALVAAEAAAPQFTRKEIQEQLTERRATCTSEVCTTLMCGHCGVPTSVASKVLACAWKCVHGCANESPLLDVLETVQLTRCRNFRALNLTAVDLSKLDLCDADFTMATLTGARFDFAKLDGANFAQAVVGDASFVGASLRNCTLPKASCMQGANLEAANMEGVTYEAE